MSALRPVAVVTGGARRLGRQLCMTLAARGFDLVILYRESRRDAQSLEQEIAALRLGGAHSFPVCRCIRQGPGGDTIQRRRQH